METENPTNLLMFSAPLTKPEHRKLAGDLLKETQRRYPNQVLPDDSAKAIKQDWMRMIAEFGATEFQAKLLGAISRCTFFPHEGDIRDAPPMYPGKPVKKTCSRCSETEGWLYLMVDGEEVPRVIRCPHREQEGFRIMANGRSTFAGPWKPAPITDEEIKQNRGKMDKLFKKVAKKMDMARA